MEITAGCSLGGHPLTRPLDKQPVFGEKPLHNGEKLFRLVVTTHDAANPRWKGVRRGRGETGVGQKDGAKIVPVADDSPEGLVDGPEALNPIPFFGA